MQPTARSNCEEAALGPASGSGNLPLWLPVVMLAIGVLAYVNGVDGPFIFDDLEGIATNEHIRQLWPLSQSLTAQPQNPVAGRPLVSFSLAVNYAIGGLNVRGYHLLNVGLHLASTLLLLGIIRRTLLTPTLRSRFGRSAPWLAATAATLWMPHPLQTEAVTYILQRTELLMAVFYLLTLYCAVRGWASSHCWPWFAASIAACAMGMASKEVMVSAPLVVMAYDRLFISSQWRTVWRGHAALHAGLAATWLLLAWLLAGGPRSESVGGNLGIRPLDYLATQAGVILHYLRLCFWPDPLVITYDDWPLAHISQASAEGLIILMLLAATAWGLRRRSGLGFLGLWFFLILAPTSSFIPIATETAAERRMYLPLAAVVLLAVLGSYRLLNFACRRWAVARIWRLGLSAAAVVLTSATLCYSTAARNHDYRSSEAIWADAVAKRPRSAFARNDLGIALAASGRLEEAIAQYNEALRLRPSWYRPHYNLGSALMSQDKQDEAIHELGEAVRLKPTFCSARTKLGIALAGQRRFDEAIAQHVEVLRITPNDPESHYYLAAALAEKAQYDEAIRHYEEAIRLGPESAAAHNGLGFALTMSQRPKEALEHFQKAIDLKPDWVPPMNAAAWLLATQPDAAVGDGDQAVRLAERAVELDGLKDAGILDTLAAAYASAGQFEKAVATAEKARTIALESGDHALTEKIAQRLVLYRQAKPYRERE